MWNAVFVDNLSIILPGFFTYLETKYLDEYVNQLI